MLWLPLALFPLLRTRFLLVVILKLFAFPAHTHRHINVFI